MDFLNKLNRLKTQPSTWAGVGGLGLLGIELQPELMAAVVPWLQSNPWLLAGAFIASLVMEEKNEGADK